MALCPLRLPGALEARRRKIVAGALQRLPQVCGKPINLSFRPALTAHRGRLLSGVGRGREVHAATFLRKRRIVLDTELIEDRRELVRILVHEMFHFVWLRLGNSRRRSFEDLLRREMERGARGELGWSAEIRKQALRPDERCSRSRRWREYLCESFCDTAARLYSGARSHEEFTLAATFRRQRERWFRNAWGASAIQV